MAKIQRKWIYPDAFDGGRVTMTLIELATTLRFSEAKPICRAVAGATEAAIFDESFEQDGTIGITGMPVVAQAAADQRQNLGCKITAMDPRQNKEPSVVYHKMEIALSLFLAPADVDVARHDLPGTRSERQGCDDFVFGTNEVAKLSAGHELMTQIMISLDVGVPQPRVVSFYDKFDTQSMEVYFR